MSVKEREDEVISEGGVFWWRKEDKVSLTHVWDDLVLLLHSMEEKQVSLSVCWQSVSHSHSEWNGI